MFIKDGCEMEAECSRVEPSPCGLIRNVMVGELDLLYVRPVSSVLKENPANFCCLECPKYLCLRSNINLQGLNPVSRWKAQVRGT